MRNNGANNERAIEVRNGFAFLRKWAGISIATGIVAGVSALVLFRAIDFFTGLFLGGLAGYAPPVPGGEGSGGALAIAVQRPWLIPVSTALGGLLSGLLVAKLAPEAKGIGTDAAIDEFHRGHAMIRTRVPLVKILASAITIGSGGTSGREGPIAQIGAGLGTQIAKAFKLTERERRIALASGLGAGISAMFKAPLAGAILSGEVFYKHDFEAEAMIPGFIASSVSYSIVGFAVGWQPIFSSGVNPVEYTRPLALLLYALLGAACAAFAHLLFKVYSTVHGRFERSRLPLFVKPAVGGLLTGLVGLLVPSVLGVGYGWMQIALNQNYAVFPVVLIILAVFAEIFSMSFTMGSGGSGGVFGPCIVTGGLIGAAFGEIARHAFPGTVPNPASYAMVGMAAFFGGAAKSPLAVIVMVAEMTGGYGLLAPAMVAVLVAYLLTGESSIYRNQVAHRADSPAHRDEYEAMALKQVHVSSLMKRSVHATSPAEGLEAAHRTLEANHIGGLPVLSGGKLVGMLTRTDVVRVHPSMRPDLTVGDVMSRKVVAAYPDDDLFSAMTKMVSKGVGRLPVVDRHDPGALVGILSRTDITRAIEERRAVAGQVNQDGT